MKNVLTSISLLTATGLFGCSNSVIKVLPAYSDSQIRQTQEKVLKRYGIKSDITVAKRDEKNNITDLKYQRYSKDGKQGGSCSSDKFGILIITPNGCKIADVGHEGDLAKLK